MKKHSLFYKNVDVKDLGSILKNGVLSINESGNNNWEQGARANNSSDVVYLFQPAGWENSFCQYGVALLEVALPVERCRKNELLPNDANVGKYEEYVVDKVEPTAIKNIYIPKIFKNRLELEIDVVKKITWCEMVAHYYSENGKEECSKAVLEQFAKTAPIEDAREYNFFRGSNNDRTVLDLYNLRYVIE